jgi:hypothetical protein
MAFVLVQAGKVAFGLLEKAQRRLAGFGARPRAREEFAIMVDVLWDGPPLLLRRATLAG